MLTSRTSVFISYSHADSQWLQLLNIHLKPLTRDQKVEIWSDQKIRKGERWRDRIHKQLAMARVGIFLVSADFLASDFIHAQELPPLLKAAEKEGAILLTVIVRPCSGAFQDSPLSQLQAMNGPHAPLSGMSRTQREQVMASIYNELREIFRTPARKPASKLKTIPSGASKPTSKSPAKKVSITTNASDPGKQAAKQIAKRKAIAKTKARVAAQNPSSEKASSINHSAKKPATKTPVSRIKKT